MFNVYIWYPHLRQFFCSPHKMTFCTALTVVMLLNRTYDMADNKAISTFAYAAPVKE